MSTDQIRTTIREFLKKDILKDTSYALGDDDALISGGLIDSFSLVDIELWVENTYGVRIEDNQLNADTFDTVAQLAQLIESRLGQ